MGVPTVRTSKNYTKLCKKAHYGNLNIHSIFILATCKHQLLVSRLAGLKFKTNLYWLVLALKLEIFCDA